MQQRSLFKLISGKGISGSVDSKEIKNAYASADLSTFARLSPIIHMRACIVCFVMIARSSADLLEALPDGILVTCPLIKPLIKAVSKDRVRHSY